MYSFFNFILNVLIHNATLSFPNFKSSKGRKKIGGPYSTLATSALEQHLMIRLTNLCSYAVVFTQLTLLDGTSYYNNNKMMPVLVITVLST